MISAVRKRYILYCATRHLDRGVKCSEAGARAPYRPVRTGGLDAPQHILPELNEMYFWRLGNARHHRDLTHEDAESYAARYGSAECGSDQWRGFQVFLPGA